MLDDISAVKTWDKVNSGMIKMYSAEVLGKLPVMQHFLFGSFLPYEGPPPPNSDERADAHDGHGHPHVPVLPGMNGEKDLGWGDCCGIPIPSVFAAAKAEEKSGLRLSGPGIRPVPFD